MRRRKEVQRSTTTKKELRVSSCLLVSENRERRKRKLKEDEGKMFTILKFRSTIYSSRLGTRHKGTDYILEKVLQSRKDDLPVSMANPYTKPERNCILCEHKIIPNYKNIKLLYQFVSPYTGLTYEKHVTGLCSVMHEKVVFEINKARKLGLMAYYHKDAEFLKDPKICDPERPLRPHKY